MVFSKFSPWPPYILATAKNGVDPHDDENYEKMVHYWFIFSVVWSIGASVDEPGRKLVDTFMRELEGSFPNKDSVYEYWVDAKVRIKNKWFVFQIINHNTIISNKNL